MLLLSTANGTGESRLSAFDVTFSLDLLASGELEPVDGFIECGAFDDAFE